MRFTSTDTANCSLDNLRLLCSLSITYYKACPRTLTCPCTMSACKVQLAKCTLMCSRIGVYPSSWRGRLYPLSVENITIHPHVCMLAMQYYYVCIGNAGCNLNRRMQPYFVDVGIPLWWPTSQKGPVLYSPIPSMHHIRYSRQLVKYNRDISQQVCFFDRWTKHKIKDNQTPRNGRLACLYTSQVIYNKVKYIIHVG